MYTTIENFFISWLNFRKSRCNNLIVSENPNFKRWSLSHLNYHIVLVYFFFYKPSENWMEIVIYVAHDHFFVILFLLCPRKMKYEWTFLCRKILFSFSLIFTNIICTCKHFFHFFHRRKYKSNVYISKYKFTFYHEKHIHDPIDCREVK